MKSIISIVAHRFPTELTQDVFGEHYRAAHPKGDSLTAENIRQGHCQYKALLRKIRQRAEGKRGPERVRR